MSVKDEPIDLEAIPPKKPRLKKRRSLLERLKGGDDEFDSVVADRNIDYSLHTFEAGILALKAALHGSFLLIPWSYSGIGHVFGFVMLVVVYGAIWSAIRILVEMAHNLTKRTGKAQLTYGDVAQQSYKSRFGEGHGAFGFRIFIDVIVFLSLFSTACLYIVQTAHLFKRSFNDPCFSIWLVILLIGIFLIIFSFIGQLKWLVPLCLVGCICIILAMIFTVVIFYSHVLEKSNDDYAVVPDFGKWPYYFGSIPFTATWIYVILPIEQESKRPLHVVSRYCSPWLMIFIFIFVAHSLIGFLGYDIFGPTVSINVLATYFAVNDVNTMITFFLVGVGVFLTINLLIVIASKIIWDYIYYQIDDEYSGVVQIVLPPAIMFFCVTFALFFCKYSVVLSMLATLTVGLVSFIFPPVLNFIVTRRRETKPTKIVRYAFNILLILIGLVVMTCGFLTDLEIWMKNKDVGTIYMEH